MTARNQRLIVGGLLITLAIALAVGLAVSLAGWPAVAGADEPSVPAPAWAAMAPGGPGLAAGSAPEAAVGRVASSAASMAMAGAARSAADGLVIPPEGFEFCGVRRVPADELRRWVADRDWGRAQAEALQEEMQRVGQAGVARIAARLAAGNDHQQVAARLLMQDRDGAALLAGRSSDPLAYQMALTACSYDRGTAPHCARLNPRRWAALDPSDARPWLQVMQAEQQRKNAAGVDAALAEAAARPRLSRGSYLLMAQAVPAAGALPDGADLSQAWGLITFLDHAMSGFEMSLPTRVCKGEALRDATRLGHCRALARQVLAHTTDLMEASLAQMLADRVGVPPEQQAYDATTLKAAGDHFSALVAQDIGMDCTAMQRWHQLSSERATSGGDLAMALALLRARQPSR